MMWHTGNKRLLWQHLTTMVIDKIRKMSIKGVKLKSESFFSISPGVLELWRKNVIPPVQIGLSHLSLQPLFPCIRRQQCFTTVTIRSFDHFEHLELLLSLYCIVLSVYYSLRIANYMKIFNQAASTRCSVDNKENLYTNIRSEYGVIFSITTNSPLGSGDSCSKSYRMISSFAEKKTSFWNKHRK